MQIPPLPPSSQSWAEKFLWALGGGTVLTFILGFIKLIFYRNKPRSEVAQIDATTENLRIDGYGRASDNMLRMIDRMVHLEQQMDKRNKEFESTVKFYREQIEGLNQQVRYFEDLDLAYRNRSHAIGGELNRLTMELTSLRAEYATKTGEELPPFTIKTGDWFVAEFPLPKRPAQE